MLILADEVVTNSIKETSPERFDFLFVEITDIR